MKNQKRKGKLISTILRINWDAHMYNADDCSLYTHQSIHGTGFFVMVKTRALFSGHIN
jgi:hypothetical protein